MSIIDKEFFQNNINTYYHYVYNITRKFYFDDCTCSDLTQDIMIKLICASGTFKTEAEFKSWVYLVSKNHCINYLQRDYKKYIQVIQIDENYYNISEQNVLSTDIKNKIKKSIQKLPRHLREPIFFLL